MTGRKELERAERDLYDTKAKADMSADDPMGGLSGTLRIVAAADRLHRAAEEARAAGVTRPEPEGETA